MDISGGGKGKKVFVPFVLAVNC